jgi:flagellar protein FliS
MKQEQKQAYTRRICQANRSEMIVILYELLENYLDEAKQQLAADDYEGFRSGVSSARQVLCDLMCALDRSYGLSAYFLEIYRYFIRALSRALARKDASEFDRLGAMVKKLRHAFEEVAKTDKSQPLMQHTQQVYAGLTYGKGVLNESCQEEAMRGFFA